MSEKPRVRVNKHGLVLDGLSNVVTGLGAGSPRVAASYYDTGTALSMSDAAFRTSTWYGKILTIPVDDAVRKWRVWNASDEQVQALEREEARLDFRMRVREALLMARHEGGALVVVGGLRGSLESPLREETITQGSLEYMHVLSKSEVTAGELERDPLSKNYGKPRWWGINTSGRQVRIHPSRVAPINGRHVPGSLVRRGEFWGDSIWLHLSDAVLAADSGAAIVSALMHEAKLDIVSIPDLSELLTVEGGESRITQRWLIANRMKSLAGILLIDGGPGGENAAKEDWQQKQIRWDGLPDVLRILLTVLSGAADIPYTRLTGDQQKGLSNNDDGSLRNYYSSVNTRQELEIAPMLRSLDEMLIRSALGSRPEEIYYNWASLYEISDAERSEMDKRDAETVQIYSNSGLIEEEALQRAVLTRMKDSGRWPGIGPEDAADDPAARRSEGAATLPGGGLDDPAASSRAAAGGTGRGGAADAAPRTLYVRRDVLNGDEIVAWAREQGFETTLPAEDMHVTVAFSRTPIDWMAVSEPWASKIELEEGGPRMLDVLGGGAKVLLFRASELEWRHESIRSAGASWDFPTYQPHITISYGAMPDDAEPYRGRILLGPEIFEEVDESWREGIAEE